MERDKDYVWYRLRTGNEIGFPKSLEPNAPDCGWYMGEHFKRPDGSIKEVLGDATLIVEGVN